MGRAGRAAQELEYVAPETRAMIERMCGYLDDGTISRHAGCAVATVKHIRSRITRKRRGRPPRQAHVIATKSEIQDQSIILSDKRRRDDARHFSDSLLRRQLEAGQHSLTADQFNALCIAKGWIEPARKSGS